MGKKMSRLVINHNTKYIFQIFIVGLVIFFINKYLFQICFVVGDSMSPSLEDKNIILIKKFDLDLKYGDIIIAKKNGKTIIKRIVGIPGDKVEIDGYLYINGNKKNDYLITNNGEIEYPVILNSEEYFVLGDNLEQSKDSRTNEIGIIRKSEILGKMIFNKPK